MYSPLKKYNSSSQKWEVDIAKLENLDNYEKYSNDALLFIGSSSIRRWISIKKDMAPYETIKRGYGGAHYSDIIHFSKRLVKNHKTKAILIFVANDRYKVALAISLSLKALSIFPDREFWVKVDQKLLILGLNPDQ